MAVPTIPGAQKDQQNPVNLSGDDSQTLNDMFADSFNSLMSQDGSDDGDGASSPTLPGGLPGIQQDTISAVGGGPATKLSVDGYMGFIGGAGSTPQYLSDNATIFGTANTTYHYSGPNLGGVATFKTSDGGHLRPENIWFDASQSSQALHISAGLGDTIQGGHGADTISVHNTVQGGSNDGATLSGGSGANDLFSFLNNKGGKYTIQDFKPGDKIGIKATDGDIQKMLANQKLDKGGNVTIDLPNEQGQITFVNPEQLKPKDFQKF